MKISIIVPIYNAEKYLEEALESLINQSLKDIEIICVNDGSTDKSLEILQKYAKKDKRVKILSQTNKGQSAARNTGIKVATGEYIGFLDADDWAESNTFEELYSNANGSDISVCSILACNNGIKNNNDPYLSTDIFPKSFEKKAFSAQECKNFIFRISVTPWNKIYKKDFLTKNSIYFAEGINFEDNIFFLETFLNASSIRLLKKPLINYRIDSETSYSHGKNDYKKLDFFKIVDAQESILKKSPIFDKDMFELHKKSTLYYWYKKITNPMVKTLYWLKLIKMYPSLIISPFTKKQKIKKILKNLPADCYIWFEENSQVYLENLFEDFIPNIKGFVSHKNNMKEFLGKQVVQIKTLPPQTPIITFSSKYYKWSYLINEELGEVYNIKDINIPLW